MTISIAHLGPSGTYTETTALAYADWLTRSRGENSLLCPYATIAQTLQAVYRQEADLAIVPVENSIHGSVAMTLDTLWELDGLRIKKALILPIRHALISHSPTLESVKTVYSHPQALGQCQNWLVSNLPTVQQIASNSTTEALKHLQEERTSAAIASKRAARLYNLPVLVPDINDYRGNCTRFWAISTPDSLTGTGEPWHEGGGEESGAYVSLAFSVPANVPGALVKPLQAFAQRNINLSRIESRPTKRSLGEYLFFIDLEGNGEQNSITEAIAELQQYVEVLKIFGNYDLCDIQGETILS